MVNVRPHVKQSGAEVAAHSRMPPGAIRGGEFIAPNVTPLARKFILMARTLMYSDGLAPALHKAVAGGKYLSDGAVPFISQLVVMLAHRAKAPLSDVDMHAVIVHLAGSLVDLAQKMGRPSAANKRAQVKDIVEGVMAVLSGKVVAMAKQAQGGGQPPPQVAMQPAQPMPPQPQQASPLLASANG